MGKSFVNATMPGLGRVGFWANDGLLGIWLVALAGSVPVGGVGWQTEVAEHWREQGVGQYMGCMDAGLDAFLVSEERRAVAVELSRRARVILVAAAEDGRIRPAWLVAHGLAVDGCERDSYHRDGVGLALVLQVADAFIDLLNGRVSTTAATAPVYPFFKEPGDED